MSLKLRMSQERFSRIGSKAGGSSLKISTKALRRQSPTWGLGFSTKVADEYQCRFQRSRCHWWIVHFSNGLSQNICKNAVMPWKGNELFNIDILQDSDKYVIAISLILEKRPWRKNMYKRVLSCFSTRTSRMGFLGLGPLPTRIIEGYLVEKSCPKNSEVGKGTTF